MLLDPLGHSQTLPPSRFQEDSAQQEPVTLKKAIFTLSELQFSPVNKCTVVSYKDLLEQLIIPGAPQAIAATAGITYSRQSTLLTGIINIFRNIQQPMR